ncbi:YgiQ family radical SAM protein, partial [Desulfovibrio sp. OttesenSCG-928-M14]|nr:YgiQ family radical SAM protein [Desulfovibrio sp. OttesenSCG-928-M14]
MSRKEMDELGWDAPDILLLCGDAYVDHPSFGAALLGRMLEAQGFRVCMAAQPAWEGPKAITALQSLGRPRLFAGVTAGAIDSMLAHYTAFRKKRHNDAYSPGNRAGLRPNRACIVYTGLLRQAFPGLPVLLGGIEASLRRLSHYDFWGDALRRSILLDSKADLVLWGMGEHSLSAAAATARKLSLEANGAPLDRALFARACRGLAGIAFATSLGEAHHWLAMQSAIFHELPSHEAIVAD